MNGPQVHDELENKGLTHADALQFADSLIQDMQASKMDSVNMIDQAATMENLR